MGTKAEEQVKQRTFADLGTTINWVVYAPGISERHPKDYELISSIQIDLQTKSGFVTELDHSYRYLYTTIHENAPQHKLGHLKLTSPSTFEASYVVKGRRAIVQAQLTADYNLELKTTILDPETMKWEMKRWPHDLGRLFVDVAKVALNNEFELEFRLCSFGVFKLMEFNFGEVVILDRTAKRIMTYPITGATVALALGSPVDGAKTVSPVSIYPKIIAPTQWKGAYLDFVDVLGLNSLVITKNNMQVLSVSLDELENAFPGLEFSKMGKMTLGEMRVALLPESRK